MHEWAEPIGVRQSEGKGMCEQERNSVTDLPTLPPELCSLFLEILICFKGISTF